MKILSYTTDSRKSNSDVLSDRLLTLAQTYVPGLVVRYPKGSGRCCFHQEATPSLSFNFEKGVYHCFGCGKGGGVRDFALAVGEQWGTIRHSPRERVRFAVQARRREAEAQAGAILARRAAVHRKTLLLQNAAAIQDVNSAAELLELFHRRPDLADEFSELVTRTEQEYGDALFKQTILEAQLVEGVEVRG